MSDLAEEGSRRKRRFSEEFKRDAVRLIVEEGYTIKSAAYSIIGQITLAAKAAGVTHGHVYYWRKRDEAFATCFLQAQKLAADSLLDAAMQRAIEGLDRLKFGKNGEAIIDPRTGQVYVEKQCSDILLIFLLKKLDPERFGDDVGGRSGPQEVRVVFDDSFTDDPTYRANAAEIIDEPPAILPSAQAPESPPVPPAGLLGLGSAQESPVASQD